MEVPVPPSRSARKQIMFYLLALGVYTVLIHAPFLSLPPLGEDYPRLAGAAALSRGQNALLEWTGMLLGTRLLLWHALNLLLSYLCSVCVFFIAWLMLGRPMWIASFAAVLFMANPAKVETVFNVTGVITLIPSLAACVSLLLMVLWVKSRRWGLFAGGLAAFLGAMALDPVHLALLIPIALLPLALPVGPRQLAPAAGALGLAAAFACWMTGEFPLDLDLSLTALTLILYPIGLLPSSVVMLHAHPWLGWAIALLAVVPGVLLLRKARHPALLFSLLGACAVWWVTPDKRVDLVSMAGGGRLMLPMVLATLGLAALCQSVLRHPKWIRPVILITACWCLVHFGLVIRAGLQWKEAGAFIQQAQREAQALGAGAPLLVAPDYQSRGVAPLMVYLALAFDTPFGRSVPVEAALPLHLSAPFVTEVSLEDSSGHPPVITLRGANPALMLEPCLYTSRTPAGSVPSHRAAPLVSTGPDSTLRVELDLSKDAPPRRLFFLAAP